MPQKPARPAAQPEAMTRIARFAQQEPAPVHGPRHDGAGMGTGHLYNPAPLASWPVRLWRPVGTTYRNAAGEGLCHDTCLRLAVGAYVAAGGKAAGAERAVQEIVAALAAEKAGWLWEPAQAWLEGRPVLTSVPFTPSSARPASLEAA